MSTARHASRTADSKAVVLANAATGLALILTNLVWAQAASASNLPHQEPDPVAVSMPTASPPARANFADEAASIDARALADWVVRSGDNTHLAFVIVDKRDAKVFAFDSLGVLMGAAPALLGLATGDDSPPGIGERKLSTITPAERITPAGRFVAALGQNFSAQDILWVDYDSAISLHRVITTKATERRLERLATAETIDNRISYGCINVPVPFYEGVLRPLFNATTGIVYIMPETRSIEDVFGMKS